MSGVFANISNTKYHRVHLKDIRRTKKVKPIYFTQFPKDLDAIQSVKIKKVVRPQEGENISQLSINSKWALILSSEAHGVSLDFDKFNKELINNVVSQTCIWYKISFN